VGPACCRIAQGGDRTGEKSRGQERSILVSNVVVTASLRLPHLILLLHHHLLALVLLPRLSRVMRVASNRGYPTY
jgi:hypothetical protein